MSESSLCDDATSVVELRARSLAPLEKTRGIGMTPAKGPAQQRVPLRQRHRFLTQLLVDQSGHQRLQPLPSLLQDKILLSI